MACSTDNYNMWCLFQEIRKNLVTHGKGYFQEKPARGTEGSTGASEPSAVAALGSVAVSLNPLKGEFISVPL
jgi:hypothetical protein